MRIPLLATVAAVALLAPTAAGAQTYPEPKEPGPVQTKPKGPHKTLTVCKQRRRCDFRTIQKAVNKARAGDTIRVRNGVYREAVTINGKRKRYLRLIGNRAHPNKVLLRARGNMQNGIFVNAADQVTVDGFMARGYKSNGFFFTNLNGYTMNHLIARQTGVYGLYAFNTIGGRILNSEAYYVNDGAFYIGQTPPQAKPVQTIVRNVSGWGSPLGFSATNMRYVTITKSRFYNNAAGIVPNALDSEKFPPAENNVIVDNDIFWNNFNFHQGKPPFKVRQEGTAALVPVGTGILLLGGRGNRIENNRIYGNFLTGVAAVEGILLVKNPQARSLDNNIVRNNQFGLGGTDVNGSDLMYDGNGTNNCFSMEGVTSTFPADRSTFAGCGGANAFSPSVQQQMTGFIGENALKGWNKHPHPPKAGYKPLEVFG
ncbi:MAG TPA: right-handed parallel beta-helix repeat-containing protein [Solirubrobacter sp.]|nr:right-handed parallel beta-helix repeat-containing protein [Solirubrobacter sp.]